MVEKHHEAYEWALEKVFIYIETCAHGQRPHMADPYVHDVDSEDPRAHFAPLNPDPDEGIKLEREKYGAYCTECQDLDRTEISVYIPWIYKLECWSCGRQLC